MLCEPMLRGSHYNFIYTAAGAVFLFFVIGNMSVCKFIIKFIISLTSLIIKSAQQYEKIHFFL